tara:strand:+ start:211 stop:426 length:216 start_codon:yes stop_codon:yes gene_type:complete
MTPKQKAIELVNKFAKETQIDSEYDYGVECALICVDEMLLEHITPDTNEQWCYYMGCRNYWDNVKKAIKKL